MEIEIDTINSMLLGVSTDAWHSHTQHMHTHTQRSKDDMPTSNTVDRNQPLLQHDSRISMQ